MHSRHGAAFALKRHTACSLTDGGTPLLDREGSAMHRCMAVLLAGLFAYAGSAAGAATNPCRIVGKDDVLRILGWHVDTVRGRRYDFGGLSGGMCNMSSRVGSVTVIVPDIGSEFPGLTPDNTPDSGTTVQSLRGLGADVQLFNGTVYITSGHHRVAVRVVPEAHPASNQEIEPFAKIAVAHMR